MKQLSVRRGPLVYSCLVRLTTFFSARTWRNVDSCRTEETRRLTSRSRAVCDRQLFKYRVLASLRSSRSGNYYSLIMSNCNPRWMPFGRASMKVHVWNSLNSYTCTRSAHEIRGPHSKPWHRYVFNADRGGLTIGNENFPHGARLPSRLMINWVNCFGLLFKSFMRSIRLYLPLYC